MKAVLDTAPEQNITIRSSGAAAPLNLTFDNTGSGGFMKAAVNKTTTQNVMVQSTDGVLQTYDPVTLKNQIQEIASIEDIRDVDEIDVSSGSTLIYNSANDKYEIRKLQADDILGTFNLDGGEF